MLLFAVPASPLTQPLACFGGNVLSALVGIFVAKAVADPTLAAGLAVKSAIAIMSLLRCLHPPGGAVALSAALGAKGVASSYLYALVPVGVNTALLLGIAILFHRRAGHDYSYFAPRPHHAAIVVDDDSRSIGLVTQTDLIATLSVAPALARPARESH